MRILKKKLMYKHRVFVTAPSPKYIDVKTYWFMHDTLLLKKFLTYVPFSAKYHFLKEQSLRTNVEYLVKASSSQYIDIPTHLFLRENLAKKILRANISFCVIHFFKNNFIRTVSLRF